MHPSAWTQLVTVQLSVPQAITQPEGEHSPWQLLALVQPTTQALVVPQEVTQSEPEKQVNEHDLPAKQIPREKIEYAGDEKPGHPDAQHNGNR